MIIIKLALIGVAIYFSLYACLIGLNIAFMIVMAIIGAFTKKGT